MILDASDADGIFCRILRKEADGPAAVTEKLANICQTFSARDLSQNSYWQEEWILWSLLRKLARSPLPIASAEKISVGGIVQTFLETDPRMVHLLRVKEWLEEICGTMIPAEIRKIAVPAFSELKEVMHVDPDNLSRLILDQKDLDYDQAQLMTIWDYLRRGQIQEAISWCLQVDQGWRAAIIAGGFVHEDPRLDGGHGEPTGNPNRALWKEAVVRLIKDMSVGNVEKAVYASLVGDVNGIESVCKDWKDLLWASIVSIVEDYIEEQTAHPGHKVSTDGVRKHLAMAFDYIETHPRLKPLKAMFYPAIKALILEDNYFGTLFDLISSPRSKYSANILRFAAASIVVYRACGHQPTDHYDLVISAYLDSLPNAHHEIGRAHV